VWPQAVWSTHHCCFQEALNQSIWVPPCFPQ
jgi:hypothetical protein